MRPIQFAHLLVVSAGLYGTAGIDGIGAVGAQESPLIGKECPKFEVSHPVQGPAWKLGDLSGSIVVLDLFQLG